MRLAGLPEYSVDWQHLFCLLHALDDLGVENTRTETVEFIRAKQYLRLAPADREPYPTQTEPRWQTDIAYARKIGVISGLVSYNARDAWGISRPGREVIRALIAKGREIQVHRCFLWSTDFKRTLCPEYRPSVIDLPRPERWTRINTLDPILSSVADTLLSLEDIHSVVEGMSRSLGFTVSANRVSLAFALQELQHRKNAGSTHA